jgi:hypothetical protein
MSIDTSFRNPSRRHFLRGMGVALALPWMESLPLFAQSSGPAVSSGPPLRLGIVYFSNGVEPIHWWAKGTGANMEIGPALAPMMPHREDMLFIKGLYNQTAQASSSPHLGRMNVLSGAPVSLDPKVIQVGTSMDQIIASQIGSRTWVPPPGGGMEAHQQGREEGHWVF